MSQFDAAHLLVWLTHAKLRASYRAVLGAILGEMVAHHRDYAELNQAEIATLSGCSHRRVRPFLDELSRMGLLVVEAVPDMSQMKRRRLRFYLGSEIITAMEAPAPRVTASAERQDQATGMPAQSGREETAMRPARAREKTARSTTTSDTPPAA